MDFAFLPAGRNPSTGNARRPDFRGLGPPLRREVHAANASGMSRSVFIPVRHSPGVLASYRRKAADPRGEWVLSGRKDPAHTERVNAMIESALSFGPDDDVLDIGCGDASLLQQIRPRIKSATGILPTDEEVKRVFGLDGITIVKGDAADFSLPVKFTKIVANGVLHILGSERALTGALRSIANAAAPGAAIFIGEFPSKRPKPKSYSSALHAIKYAAQQSGIGFAARYAAHLMRRKRAVRFVRPSPFFLAVEPARFAGLCSEAGLSVISYSPTHAALGEPESQISRFNYLLTR
ncbi:MAG: hypothetical protein KF750_14325 [Xanthobacteraceae bacterium]|nr:hypothetical protein [Xanthobacteraceae bacterium]